MAIPIKEIIDVTVNTGALAAANATYDIGLILVESSLFPSSITSRTAVYSSTQEIIEAGFSSDFAEKVSIYFSQNPAPSKIVIGRADDSESSSETKAQAFAACRADNSDWYACCCPTASDSEQDEIASVIESFDIPSIYVYSTTDANCLVNDGNNITNIMKTLKNKNYKRTFGIYAADTQEVADNAFNTTIAVLGVICGRNSTTASSAYTLAFKTVTGVLPQNLSTNEYLNLKSYNGNAYTNVANKFNFIMPGVMASGVHYDEVFALDILKGLIENNILNLLASHLVVPQTDDGVSILMAQIASACDEVVSIGYIAPGIWRGNTVKTLQYGDALPKGYAVLADTVEEQSQTDREQRIAPPMYACVKMAGATEHATVAVYVNR